VCVLWVLGFWGWFKCLLRVGRCVGAFGVFLFWFLGVVVWLWLGGSGVGGLLCFDGLGVGLCCFVFGWWVCRELGAVSGALSEFGSFVGRGWFFMFV